MMKLPTARNGVNFLIATTLFCIVAPSALSAPRAYQSKSEKPIKGRPGVLTVSRLARLSNDRVLYSLSQSGNEGASVQQGLDKQIEDIRRPYQPYRPAPTTADEGFTSLGLDAGGGWNALGFFNLYINDIGFNSIAPEMSTAQSEAQSSATFVWKNSQATCTQTFVLREHDDKLLMKLQVEPREGVTIERMVLQLRNSWNRANNVYGNPSSLEGAIVTGNGESSPARRIDLNPSTGSWIVYTNKALNLGASALQYLPSQVTKGHILRDDEQSVTTLFLNPAQRAFHFALWEVHKQSDNAFINYLKASAPELGKTLEKLAAVDWSKPLPAVASDAPLHLQGTTYVPKADETERGFVAYASHPLRYVDANTLPDGSAPQLQLQAAPGQQEQAAFALYALRDLGRIRITASTLSGADGASIDVQNIDLRVVKVWPQQISLWGGSAGEFAMTPELLVRNDTLSLDEAWTGAGTFHPTAQPVVGYATGPTLTDLPRDTSRQIWFMVRVPENAKPGRYRGTVTVAAQNGTELQLPLALEVLPITLATCDERYSLSIYYRGQPQEGDTVSANVSSSTVSPTMFRQQLQDIKDHGFNTAWLIAPSLERFKTAMLPVYDEVGFSGPPSISGWGFAYNKNFDEKTNAQSKARIAEYLGLFEGKAAPYFYGIDEPQGERIQLNLKRADQVRSVEAHGLKGLYSSAGNGDAMTAHIGHLDNPIISSYFASRAVMQQLNDKYHAAGAQTKYYWQIWGEYPKGTRLNAGYFLRASGYDGYMPYVYQHFESDPYREDQDRGEGGSLKSMLVAYPCNEGLISTLQWEAARAGIWDLRYLITLDQTIKDATGRAPQSTIDAALTFEKQLMEKYGYGGSDHWGKMVYGALNWPDHQTSVSPEQFDSDRAAIAQWILKLQK